MNKNCIITKRGDIFRNFFFSIFFFAIKTISENGDHFYMSMHGILLFFSLSLGKMKNLNNVPDAHANIP